MRNTGSCPAKKACEAVPVRSFACLECANGPNSARAISASFAKQAAAVVGRLDFPPNDGRDFRQSRWWSYYQDEGVTLLEFLPPRPPPEIPGGERNGDIHETAGHKRPMLAQHPVNEMKY